MGGSWGVVATILNKVVSEDLRNEIRVTSIEEGVHSVDVSKDKNTGVGVCLA